MSWTRYLLHDFWTAREFNEIEDTRRSERRSHRRHRSNAAAERMKLRDRVEELEQDLAETSLLVHTLADLCVEKGALAAGEMVA